LTATKYIKKAIVFLVVSFEDGMAIVVQPGGCGWLEVVVGLVVDVDGPVEGGLVFLVLGRWLVGAKGGRLLYHVLLFIIKVIS
jgi:hypothetical protein